MRTSQTQHGSTRGDELAARAYVLPDTWEELRSAETNPI
jgi:hypothetical protein